MSSVCPAGHDSSADDYCDVCGLPIGEPAAEAPASPELEPAAESVEHPDATCPNCGVVSASDVLFCEACGYDFTTGTAPRSSLDLGTPAEPSPVVEPVETPEQPSTSSSPERGTSEGRIETPDTWVAEIWVDPDWYAAQQSNDPLPSAGLPVVTPLKSTSLLVGRESRSRGIDPDIDLGSDHGISRRHCQLTTDGRRWFVEDLDSSNGTFVGKATGVLPDEPLKSGRKQEIGTDDRIYLGAWTRITIRKAQPGEI